MYLPPNGDLHKQVLFKFHHTPIAGHRGPKVTTKALSRKYYSPGLGRDVEEYMIRTCTMCQTNKHSTQKRPGLLKPLPIRAVPFKIISMDFMTRLPTNEPMRWDAIIVIVDRFSKVACFLPTQQDNPSYGVRNVANLFFHHWVCLYGLLEDIVSDRD